jgi:hypothetical protein
MVRKWSTVPISLSYTTPTRRILSLHPPGPKYPATLQVRAETTVRCAEGEFLRILRTKCRISDDPSLKNERWALLLRAAQFNNSALFQ